MDTYLDLTQGHLHLGDVLDVSGKWQTDSLRSQNTLTPMGAYSSAGHKFYPSAGFVNAAS
jgi:hypothetical protein